MPHPELRDVQVLVTGGAGFIGSHLAEALAARGARVRVLDNLATGSRANLAPLLERGAAELIEGDVRDAEACARACRDVRYVFHQAALGSVPRSIEDPATTIDVNVTGTARVLAAARDAGAARVIYASSSSVYGDSDRLPKREGEEGRPLSPYALSKAMNEELAEVFAAVYGMELIGLRYFNVYGPRQSPDGPYAAVVPLFFAAARDGRRPRIHGDGEQSRDFTYVVDAVEANLLAAGAPAAACGRAYNVAAGRRTTINELAHAVGAAAGVALDPEHGPERPGDVRHSLADSGAAAEALGFRAAVALANGLEQTGRADHSGGPRR
jgi:nucleoside-diphosphate-sugar epimerase